jgi:hypothetical protein
MKYESFRALFQGFKPLFGRYDPDPHQGAKSDPDPHPDPHQSDDPQHCWIIWVFLSFLLSLTRLYSSSFLPLRFHVVLFRIGRKRPIHLLSSLEMYGTPWCVRDLVYCRQCVGGGEGGGLNPVSCWRPYAAGLLQSVSDQIYNLQNCFSTPRQKPRRLGGFKPVLGSLAFWCGSGSRSVDPYLWLIEPNPDPTPYTTPFFSDFRDARKNFFLQLTRRHIIFSLKI